MKTPSIAINACNLHTGGGIQVATSFIDELTRMTIKDIKISVFVSSAVNENLISIASNTKKFDKYEVLNTTGIASLKPSFCKVFKNYDLTFTVFGPSYFLYQKGHHINGFAQAWITNKKNEAYRLLGLSQKIKSRTKYFIQAMFFRRADTLIVELDHVKHGVIASKIAPSEKIQVVHNCLSSLYLSPEKWLPVALHKNNDSFSIGFVGRDYAHKNTSIIPEIKKIIYEKYNLSVVFYVTLNDTEWSKKTDEFKKSVINVGALKVAQCPSFYEKMDAIIFPSLLESFSATPLESLAMEKPLFASDRSFVRDICKEFAWYFDPMSPESAADIIAQYILTHSSNDQARLKAARDHAINFSTARQRADEYLKIIKNSLSKV